MFKRYLKLLEEISSKIPLINRIKIKTQAIILALFIVSPILLVSTNLMIIYEWQIILFMVIWLSIILLVFLYSKFLIDQIEDKIIIDKKDGLSLIIFNVISICILCGIMITILIVKLR